MLRKRWRFGKRWGEEDGERRRVGNLKEGRREDWRWGRAVEGVSAVGDIAIAERQRENLSALFLYFLSICFVVFIRPVISCGLLALDFCVNLNFV